jgi:hypothetical protein
MLAQAGTKGALILQARSPHFPAPRSETSTDRAALFSAHGGIWRLWTVANDAGMSAIGPSSDFSRKTRLGSSWTLNVICLRNCGAMRHGHCAAINWRD